MVVEIQSESVKVQCLQEGAMLHSLVKDGVEYLWQGDPQYWAGQAPVCFPITGVLRNEKAVAFGKPCVMKWQGSIRLRLPKQVQITFLFFSVPIRKRKKPSRLIMPWRSVIPS